jgi:hypothetical protein
MEEFDLLTQMERVEAPPGFEQRVLARVAERKRQRRKTRRVGFSLATAAASLAVVVLAVNFLVLSERGPGQVADLKKEITPDFQNEAALPTLPITETMNLSGEFRQVSHESRTIYILEQVSDRTDTRRIY